MLLAVLATAAGAATAVPSPASAAPAAAPAATRTAPGHAPLTIGQATGLARESGKPVQVTGLTTATSTLTANPNGTLTATESTLPVRKDVGGTWLPLDPTLHRNADGSVAPAVTSAVLRLSGGGTSPLAVVSDGTRALSMTFPRPLPAPSLAGATATYRDVLPGVDLVVTVTREGGFDAVLVVRDAAAAANPALAHLAFGTSVTGGLSLRSASSGEVAAVDRAGRVVFDEPAPRMWDSATPARKVPTAVRPSTGQQVDLHTGQPATSAAAGPGEAARTARVGVSYAHGTVSYVPDLSLLAGQSTRYPVYIDPGVSLGGTEQFWAQVDTIDTGAKHPKPTPDTQVGFEGWPSSGASNFVARSYFTMTLPQQLWGTPKADVYSASFKITEDIAPACMSDFPNNDFGVQVWRTGYVGSTAVPTWASQPAAAAEEDEKAVSNGYTGCPAASVGFSVLEAAQWAAGASSIQPTVTFMLKADDETDKYGWKEFLPDATLSINFDKPPTISNFNTSPSAGCTANKSVGKGDVHLYATVKSPFGANASLTPTFYASRTSDGTAISGSILNPSPPKSYTSGSPVSAVIPEATLNSLAGSSLTEFTWYVTVSDGTLTASSASVPCHFTYDPTTPGAPFVVPVESSWTIGTPAHFNVTPPDGVTVSGYDYQLNGNAPTFIPVAKLPITVTPTARTEVLSVTSVSAAGNSGIYAYTVPFQAQPPATPQADGDLTGDGVPDLTIPGGTATGLAPGLWLAQGQAGSGQAAGDGSVSTTLADIGPEGNGLAGDYSPADFTGGQVISGLFDNSGFQDTLTYYPPGTATHGGSYAGEGVILYGNGDGTATSDQNYYTNGADSSDTTEIQGLDTFDGQDKTASGIQGATSDLPLQLANAYHAQTPASSSVNASTPLPDLIAINGHPITAGDNVMPGGSGQLSYYLEYYPNGSEPGAYGAGSIILDTTCTPDSTSSTCNMDWNDWQIATMAEPASTAYPNGAADMFLYKHGTGALYLWQNFAITPDPTGLTQFGTASFSPYLLAASGWQPVTGSGVTLGGLRAADITGSGPALWAVGSNGAATPWYASGLTPPTGSATVGTGTITAGTAQSLVSPTHQWRLNDAASGAIGASAAADTGTSASSGFALTGTGNVNWDSAGGLFNPAASLNQGTVNGYLTETAGGVGFNNNNFTISAWVKPTALGGAIFAQSGGTTSCFMAYIDTTTVGGVTYGRWNFRFSNADTSSPTWYTATAGDTHYVKLGAWTHLTATYFNGTDPATGAAVQYLRLYVNGIPAAAVNPAVTWAGHCSTFSIGRYLDGGVTHGLFQGDIADVQAWAGLTMTPTEAANLSGTPGYTLFPSDGTVYTSAASSSTYPWTAQCGSMQFYLGQIKIKQPGGNCTGSGTFTFGPSTQITTGSRLILQGDGNLVSYDGGTAKWSSGTQGNPDDVMFFQPDGNLVIYGPYGEALWSTNTQNAPIYN